MKGYKGFDKDLSCRGFQYEVGKTYECEGKITLCENGFHFCEDPKRICDYYDDLTVCRYCEIEASGEIVEGEGKCACSKISIVREISLQEFLSLVNKGSGNTGWMNEGDGNEGDGNKGSWNEGYDNEGDENEGNRNVGDGNKGDGNKGDGNEGSWNVGSWNVGSWNKGDSNKGYLNEGDQNIGLHNRGDNLCGLFNTDSGCVIFNKYTRTKWTDIVKMDGYYSLSSCIQNRKSPSEEQLEEIKKLPNFSEKVMNELIFGKGDKK